MAMVSHTHTDTGTHADIHAVDGELRLVQNGVASSSFSAGRLEIFLYGQWGTICDNFFGTTEADVACQQLGYTSALQFGNNLGYVQILGSVQS